MTEPYLVDLAARDLGGSVVAANDELFAARENLIRTQPPVFQPHVYGPKGQIMDGWETRRRREPGHDWAIVRLGCAGVVRTVVIDTAYFTGNFPPEASVEACGVDGYPSTDALATAQWTTLVPRSKLAGDAVQEFSVDDPHRFTHLRLSIYPDGGVARLRVLGHPIPDPRLLPHTIDLAALENGGRIVGSSNSFYSSPNNLIKPGLAQVMGDGWEVARRRDDGNDWALVRLACEARVVLAEIDTTHFVGNAPGWAAVTGSNGVGGPGTAGADVELLPRTALQPDTRHRFVIPDVDAVAEVRMDVFPDGGVSRLRLFGAPTRSGRTELALRFINAVPDGQLADFLRACCAAQAWVTALLASRPFADEQALLSVSDDATAGMDDAALAEALASHPRIGERLEGAPGALGALGAQSRLEQSGLASAADDVRSQLATANTEYEQRFGHVYLVCAAGKSAEELLATCLSRLGNDPVTERGVVLAELAKINRLRLGKMFPAGESS